MNRGHHKPEDNDLRQAVLYKFSEAADALLQANAYRTLKVTA